MTVISVIDTETTGDGPEDTVVELAAVLVGTHRVESPGGIPAPWTNTWFIEEYETRVRPRGPISPEARAAHHITDAELATAPEAVDVDPLSIIIPNSLLHDYLRGEDYYIAAHNAEFDVRMLRQTWPNVVLPPAICTYRCARHLFPDAPRFSNQVLRYWLDLKVSPSGPPHRALPDAEVTAALLLRLLQERTPEELCALTQTPILIAVCNLGDYRGRPWGEVPLSFLDWVLAPGKDFDADTVYTAKHWRTSDARPPLLLDVVSFGRNKGRPWGEVPRGDLVWILNRDFDPDTKHTARHHIERIEREQRAPAAPPPRRDPDVPALL